MAHGLEGAEAKARLMYATVNFTLLDQVPEAEAETLLCEGMQHAERSAQLYERLGRVDFISVISTMAEIARYLGETESASSLYNRVLSESRNPQWSEQRDLRDHLSGLRACAFYGLAGLAIEESRNTDARRWLEESSRELMGLSTRGVSDAELVEDIA
jgi:hypothetical protein